MWTAGIDASTGLPSADQLRAFNDNFMSLRRLFAVHSTGGSQLGNLTRRWYETVNGTPTLLTATARAELAGNMSPVMSGRTRADFTADFLLADPFFYAAPVTTFVGLPTASAIVSNPGDAVIGYGQGYSGGGQNFTIKLHGPLQDPYLLNASAQVSVTVPGIIPSGTSVTLDIGAYTAISTTGANFQGGISHRGARPWMIVQPGNSVFLLSSQGTTVPGTSSAEITFSPGYL